MNAVEWIAAYEQAWVGRDPEAAVELFTEDAVYRSHPFREPHTGSNGVREYWAGGNLDAGGAGPPLRRAGRRGDKVVVEWWAIMRDEGSWITLPGALLLRFAGDGRSEELREYWHVEEGRHEPPPGWGR